MIEWSPLKDRHIKGISDQGEWWIRLDKEKKVTGLYRINNTIMKWVPNTEEEETLAGMKIYAELIYDTTRFALEIEKNEK